jgi:hypothetical protein
MHERRRGIVEQLPVVDAEHEPPPARPIDERMTRPRQHVRAIRAAWIGRRQQRGERPQRDRCGRARRPYPLRGTAARARHARDLAGQPRLADTRGPGDHDAVRRALRQQLADRLELTIAPHQRPQQHARSVMKRRALDQRGLRWLSGRATDWRCGL